MPRKSTTSVVTDKVPKRKLESDMAKKETVKRATKKVEMQKEEIEETIQEMIPDVNDFNQMSEIEHVLYRPDMWMGNIKIIDFPFWFMKNDLSLEKKNVQQSRSIFHIFSEMITNASDNSARSRIAKYPIGLIKVHVKDDIVTIVNNGVPIPVEKNKDGIYVPEMVFGHFRTGINFGDIADSKGRKNEKTKLRKGAGKNGLGAKIGNVYSKYFIVECIDTIRKKKYYQRWSRNMLDKEEPIITDISEEINLNNMLIKDKTEEEMHALNLNPILDEVKITYQIEFSRFGYPENTMYTEEMIDGLRFISCNNSMSQNVPIYFNDLLLPQNLQEFLVYWRKMKFPESLEEKISKEVNGEKESQKDGSIINDGGENKNVGETVENKVLPSQVPSEILETNKFELEVVEEVTEKNKEENDIGGESEGENGNVRENGSENNEGENANVRENGTNKYNEIIHIEWPACIGKTKKKDSSILPDIEIYIGDKREGVYGLTFYTTSGAINTEGGEHEKLVWNLLSNIFESKFKNVTKDFVKTQLMKNLSLIIIFRAENPDFSDQSKVRLTFPKPVVLFSDTEKKQFSTWKIIQHIEDIIEMQTLINAKRTDGGNKKKMITLKRLNDAGYAGKKNVEKPILCYVEGVSAMGYPQKMRDFTPNGANLIGILNSGGKIINSETAAVQKLIANEQYIELKQAIGLEEKVDYTKIDNLEKLRYKELLVMTDADKDGIHIKGLLLLILAKRFPSLIKSGFVKFWCTPIITATKKGKGNKTEIKTFLTEKEFNTWKDSTPNVHLWDLKYLKGLASPNDSEIKYDLKHPRKIIIDYDEHTDNYLLLAFGKDYADLRKKWISDYEPQNNFDMRTIERMTISQFVAYELVTFSIYNVERSIVNQIDGVRLSHRKCIEGSLRKWKSSAASYNQSKFKLADLGTFCSEETNYHHGVSSLYGALRNMCQDYVGSNNIPIYLPDSQLGSRMFKGEDGGSERYVFLKMNPLIRKTIIREEDDCLLQYVYDENKKCEPVHFEPVINLLLLNGAEGIGTGSSTYWPSYNPEDIANAQLAFIDGKEIPTLIPYYNGYRGKIEIVNSERAKKKKVASLDLCYNKFTEDIVQDSKCEKVVYTGVITGNSKRAEITEIPPGTSIDKYHNYLKELVDKKVIHSMENLSTSSTPHFIIYKHVSPIPENLELIESTNLSNLVALDDLGRTVRYNTTKEYLEWWCEYRLTKYEERVKRIIYVCKEKVEAIDVNIRFLDAYFSKKITIEGRDENDVKENLLNLGFEYEMLSKINLLQLTKTRYGQLCKRKEEALAELYYYETTPVKEIWRKEIHEFIKEYRIYLTTMKERENEFQ